MKREPLSRPMLVYLSTGDLLAACAAGDDPGSAALALLYRHDQPALWAAYGGDLTAAWIDQHPGRRPWGWWRYEAVEGRRRLGGSGRPVPGPYGSHGVESWREHHGLPVLLDLDHDAPVFESSPAALRRLGELTDAEARRLGPDDFAPVVGYGEDAADDQDPES